MRVDYEVRGEEEAMLRVRGVGEHLKLDIIEIIRGAGQAALHEMEADVPRGHDSPDGEPTVASSLRATEPTFHPGGAGGGGYWEVQAGPGEDAPGHLKYLLRGTGIYGPSGNVIHSSTGGPLNLHIGGLSIFRQFQKGAPAQDAWLTHGHEAAEASIQAGLHRIGLLE